jgi:hypothetical protein
MPLINIEMIKTGDFNDGVVRCSVCRAEMKQAEINLKDRLVRLIIGSTTIMHYQCPDCKKELITMEK